MTKPREYEAFDPAGDLLQDDLEKGFAEKLDRFVSGLGHIDERWNNRLSAQNIPLWEAYLDGRVSIYLDFEIFGVPDVSDRECIKARKCAVSKRDASTGFVIDVEPLNRVNTDHRDDQVVLIQLVQLGDNPDRLIPFPARVHLIQDKALNAREGNLYRGLLDGVFQILPRFVEREGSVPTFAASSPQRHPYVIEGCPQIVDRITDYQRKDLAHWTQVGEGQNHEVITLIADDRGRCAAVFPKLIDGVLKLRNVAIGPFDL